MSSILPRIVITPGEPAGIGIDICIQLAQYPHPQMQWAVIADPLLLAQRAKQLQLPLTLHLAEDNIPGTQAAGHLFYIPISLPSLCETGKLNPEHADYVLQCLTLAIQLCQDNVFDALITGPVHKGVINQAGIPFTGHTEFLAQYTNTKKVVMMLATSGLRVALATTHLPLSKVSAAITPDNIFQTLSILHQDLKKYYSLTRPRILVCGLNPHAGEDGHLGREEIDTLLPVIKQFQAQGMQISDPLPADTLFTPPYLQACDCVLAMYHDQGLPVLKYRGFGQAINITLGLPIIRTSVDHGTALSLAGTGKANSDSLRYAISSTLEIITQNNNIPSSYDQ